MQDMDAITVCTGTAILLDWTFWRTRGNAPVITGHSILGLLLRAWPQINYTVNLHSLSYVAFRVQLHLSHLSYTTEVSIIYITHI